jgi:hypothetical protein
MKLVQGRTLQAILNGLRDDAESSRGIMPLSSEAERGRMPLPHCTLDRLLTIFRKIFDALSMASRYGVRSMMKKARSVISGGRAISAVHSFWSVHASDSTVATGQVDRGASRSAL